MRGRRRVSVALSSNMERFAESTGETCDRPKPTYARVIRTRGHTSDNLSLLYSRRLMGNVLQLDEHKAPLDVDT